MRFTPLLTAALVCAFTYMLILEREALLAFAGAEPVQTEEEKIKAALDAKPPVSVLVLKIQSSAGVAWYRFTGPNSGVPPARRQS